MSKAIPVSKRLAERIKTYSAIAGVAVAGTEASAAVVYTDVSPDFSGGVGGQYFLDLNNDGTNDFRIYHNGSYNLFIEPIGPNNEVLGSGSSQYAYPYVLSYGSAISGGASGGWYNNGYSAGYQSLNYGSYATFGNWANITDGYLGLRFQVGGQTHYGWCRMDVNASGSSWVIKDYAYESTPGASILAGDIGGPATPADSALNVMAIDIANNNDANDIQFSFTAAAQENTVGEYRLMVVKDASIGMFTLSDATAVAATGYEVVMPMGNPTYMQALTAGMTDVDGDPIVSNFNYRAVVLNMPDGTNATAASLSTPSGAFLLDLPADVAANIMPADIADANNASDMEVTFDAAQDETTVAEYRVLVVKTSQAGTFDVTAASAVPMTGYEAVTPTGSASYTVSLSSALTTTDGSPIQNYESYNIFILSTPAGMFANQNGLSAASSNFELEQAASPATMVGGMDIGDNANATDLEASFTAGANESSISEYRIVAVKSSGATTFDLAAAQALSASAYQVVTPSGSGMYTQAFSAATTDSDGDPITNYVPYQLFVWSVADGTVATLDILSMASSDVTLEVSASPAMNVMPEDVADAGDGSDMQVTFDAAATESTIDEYRIIVVKSAVAGSFDRVTAEAVLMGRYTAVSPNGSPSYARILSNTMTDSDGDAITVGTPYQVFILSMPDGTNATQAGLSMPSADITLEIFASEARDLMASDVNNNGNGSDMQVDFLKALDELNTSEYRIMVVKQADAGSFDITAAQGISLPNYTAVTPDGTVNYSIVLNAAGVDVDGDLIIEGAPYQVFILNVAGGAATADKLSDPSNSVTLSGSVGVQELTDASPIQVFAVGQRVIVNTLELNEGSGEFRLYDLSGKVLVRQTIQSSSREEIQVPVASGMYITVIQWEGTAYTKRVVLH